METELYWRTGLWLYLYLERTSVGYLVIGDKAAE